MMNLLTNYPLTANKKFLFKKIKMKNIAQKSKF